MKAKTSGRQLQFLRLGDLDVADIGEGHAHAAKTRVVRAQWPWSTLQTSVQSYRST